VARLKPDCSSAHRQGRAGIPVEAARDAQTLHLRPSRLPGPVLEMKVLSCYLDHPSSSVPAVSSP
jgi:hypothetical protein